MLSLIPNVISHLCGGLRFKEMSSLLMTGEIFQLASRN